MKPTPYFNNLEFWKSVELINIFGNDAFENGPCRPTSWVACCGYWSEFMGPACGYPIIFPTVSDCLLWFRRVLLGFTDDNGDCQLAGEVELTGIYKEVTDYIDQNLLEDVLTSEEILNAAVQKLGWEPEEAPFFISKIESIHAYMANIGSVSQWRHCLEDETITFSEDVFILSIETWDKARECIMVTLIECGRNLPDIDDNFDD